MSNRINPHARDLLYRLRYAWHFWRRTGWPVRTCFDAAWAFDVAQVDCYSPLESVEEELYYMAQDADEPC